MAKAFSRKGKAFRWLMMLSFPAVLSSCQLVPTRSLEPAAHDVVVYGGTSGGVAAAVQARRLGKTVVLIEPSHRLGGLTTGGLGQTDIGNKKAVGGISREFYQAVRRYYDNPAAWKWQAADAYRSGGQSRTSGGEDAMWTFEPSAALALLEAMVRSNEVEVVYGERLDLNGGVTVSSSAPRRIQAIRMESGRLFHGRVFIDATYEGDLMAGAGVSYTVGREANGQYKETYNGVQTAQATKHQLRPGIDPYVIPGAPSSGLLPGIDPNGPGSEGGADHRVQAYCFRMCLTDHPENRIPFAKPENYRESDYELLFRNYEAGFEGIPWHNAAMPNRKTDVNNNTGFSTDFIGQNYGYPEAGHEERRAIVQRHLDYQRGLMWTLSNHPRIPEPVRKEVGRWGLCKDEFENGGGWQDQLYIREARRMVGDMVMTQHHCQGREVAEDSVGLAAYTMDSHNVQRHLDAQGRVRNEGDVQIGGFPPYAISYRSLIPKASECANLLVPVCLSASHIAFGSIRMEPVFMVLGQSAATAAVEAINQGVSVQLVDYEKLREQLLKDGQVLSWDAPAVAVLRGLDPGLLTGLVLDDSKAALNGAWVASTSSSGFVGLHYQHDGNVGKGEKSALYEMLIPETGHYEVRISYAPHSNRASNVPVRVRHADGEALVRVDQRKRGSAERGMASLGRWRFIKTQPALVTISNEGADGYVIADAVQLVPVD